MMKTNRVNWVAAVVGIIGIAGVGVGMAGPRLCGDIVLEQSVAESPSPPRGKQRSPRLHVVHRYESVLDAAMNPIVGTVRLSAAGYAMLRVVDPAGQLIHDRRYDAAGAGVTASVRPFEVGNAGAHRVEFEVDPRLSASFELRKNGLVMANEWMVASVVMAMAGFCVLFLRILSRVQAVTRLAFALRRAQRSGDAS